MGGKRSGSPRGTELSRALSALRTNAGLTQTEVVAAVAGLSQAELSRIENARSVPDPAGLLPGMLDALRASPAERDRITAMAGAARRGTTQSRTILESGTAHFQARIRDIEDQAELVRSFHPTTVLGVLQTEDYAKAVFRGHVSDEEATRSVAERMARCGALLDSSSRRWVLIQTEGALRWNFAGASAMVRQVEHIAATARASQHVRVGVIPWHTPVDVQPLHGFHVYDFPDRRYRRDPRMVQIGTHSGTALLGEHDSAAYTTMFERLEQLAVYDAEADELLSQIAQDYREISPPSSRPVTPACMKSWSWLPGVVGHFQPTSKSDRAGARLTPSRPGDTPETTPASLHFAQLWADHPVANCSWHTRECDHPVVGRLTLSDELLPFPDNPGHGSSPTSRSRVHHRNDDSPS